VAANKEIIRRVEAIYKWLDEQIAAHQTEAGVCDACGKCCDFESFGHRLFVTTPEMIFFADKINSSNVIASPFGAKQSQTFDREKAEGRRKGEGLPRRPDKVGTPRNDYGGRCWYQVENKCTVYAHRFAGCRIFCCKGDTRFQSDLTEAVIKKFKAICEEFKVSYRYVDLPTALQNFTAETAENAEFF
jgi:Fe-S-cluster containining protein